MAKLPKHPPKAVNPPPPPYEDLRPSASSAAENAGPTNTSDSRPNIIQTHNETNTFIYNLAHRNIRVNDVSAKDPEVCSCCSVITFIVAATIISVVLTKIYHVGAFSQDDDHNDKNTHYIYSGVRTNTSLAACAAEAAGIHFYSMYSQLDSNDVRLSTYLPWNDTWQIFDVTDDAIQGTPLTTVASKASYSDVGYDPHWNYLFYVDNTGTLQELGQKHTWDDWSTGPLGDLGLKADINPMSPLTAGFHAFDSYSDNSNCSTHIEAKWLMYRPRGEDFVQEVFYDDQDYGWHEGEKFQGLDPYSGIVTMNTMSDGVMTRRLYGIGNDGRLNQWYCPDCCVNTTGLWKQGNFSFAQFSEAQPPNTILSGASVEEEPMLYFIPPNQRSVFIATGPDRRIKTTIALSNGEDMHPGTDLALAYDDYAAVLVYQTWNQSRLYSEPIDIDDDDSSPRIGEIPVGPVGKHKG